MLQSRQSLSSTQKVRKNYSRKDLIQWIAKQATSQQKSIALSFNQNLLKNGVFFLIMLQKVFPDDITTIKLKIKEKPVTEYDFEKNLLIVKKVIDKHRLQYDLNVGEIVKNKGCFDFLNWLKNLAEGLISKPIEEQTGQQQLSQSKIMSPEKKYPIMHTGYKTNRKDSSSKGQQKPHSQAKSSRNYSASKTQNPFYKIKPNKNLVQIGHKQVLQLENNRSHVVAQQPQRQGSKVKRSLYMSEWDSLDDCNEALYQLALEENILAFKGILRMIKEKVCEVGEDERLEEFLERVQAAVFGRS